jgi:hypothetical protein
VTRESIFSINLRQDFLSSYKYIESKPAKTVLFLSVPEPYLNEQSLRNLFRHDDTNDIVSKIWFTADTTQVEKLVEKRNRIAQKLEEAEVKRIIMKERDATKRPTQIIQNFGLFGKKVDTVERYREILLALSNETKEAQKKYLSSPKTLGSVFVEFTDSVHAQAASQALIHHQALQMCLRYINLTPNEIIWNSLKISWWQRIIRRIVALGIVGVLILFWTIPVAATGFISNISYLQEIAFFTWIQRIPPKLMGIIQGLLPSVLLSILMSWVPNIIKCTAPRLE